MKKKQSPPKNSGIFSFISSPHGFHLSLKQGKAGKSRGKGQEQAQTFKILDIWQPVLTGDIASSWWGRFRVGLFKTSWADLKTSCVISPRSEALLLKKQGKRPEHLSHGKHAWMKSLKVLQVPADFSHGSGLIKCLVTGRSWVSWASEDLPGVQGSIHKQSVHWFTSTVWNMI